MAAPMVKTSTPGIYRRGSRYAVVYQANGRQRKESARTLDEARKLKAARTADVARGEFQVRTTTTFRAFLSEWVERYHGNGRQGFRDSTRDEYVRLLDAYAHRFFPERLRLVDVTRHHLAQFVRWLADQSEHGRLADSTIKNALMPVRAALATAEREELIRHSPARGLVLPKREQIREDDQEEVRPLSRAQLIALLDLAPDRYRLLVELVASTGLRISEAIGLQRRHLHLDGSSPHVRIRRAIIKGRVSPPKSKHGRRSVPLPPALVSKLRVHLPRLDSAPDGLLFPSRTGTPLNPDNLRNRMLKPLVEEVGASWAGWHTLRHTYASLQLASGVNIVQLSRALGHHSASFTLDTYAHLLPGDMAPPLDLGGKTVARQATGNDATAPEPPLVKMAA